MVEIEVKYHHISNEHRSILDSNYPYSKFTVFFDMENYLLTPYKERPSQTPYAVLESYNGNTIYIDNCNVGYGGHGPHNTAEILKYLKIPDDKIESLIWNSCIQVDFDKQGIWLPKSLKLKSVFESREHSLLAGQIPLNKTIIADPDKGHLYFIAPVRDLPHLFNAIKLVTPEKLSYYIGKDTQAYLSHSLGNRDLNHSSFISIDSNEMDIICFIEQPYTLSFISLIYKYFFGESLYQEHILGGITIYGKDIDFDSTSFISKLKCAFKIFQKPVESEVWNTVPIPPPPKRPSLHL